MHLFLTILRRMANCVDPDQTACKCYFISNFGVQMLGHLPYNKIMMIIKTNCEYFPLYSVIIFFLQSLRIT